MDQPLDERKQRILRVVVEAYVRDGEPVGSKTVADDSDLGVSSATIRNEMGILEREGYISHPHTSAGRIPTDKGYRYYVDQLARPARVHPDHVREIQGSLTGTLSAIDELLQRASQLLTEITEYTSLAAAPAMTEVRLRSLELIPLGPSRALVVVVGEGGRHAEHVVSLDVSEDLVRRVAERCRRAVESRTPAEAAERLDAMSDAAQAAAGPDADEAPLLREIAAAVRRAAVEAGRTFTGGAARMVDWEPAPQARRVLELIEGGVTPLLPDPPPERIDVRIGKELKLEDLHDLSLIAAGYGLGALGVLGPTRMDYPQVMSLVDLVARSVSRALRRIEP